MNENELNHRRAGFMAALGLLAENADPAIRDDILNTLKLFGSELHKEIESDQPSGQEFLAEASPCPPGFYWNSEQQACVLIIIDEPA